MEITKEDINMMKQNWLTYEEIQSIIEAEKNIDSWNVYWYDDGMKIVREKIFSKQYSHV